ncbi:uncharacterized protein LOC111267737 isoform X6 [Varroa jacobsoni]|uniref:uncharacterized protein LOC111267737 isoform X6 n=1 Tax=Varroa jacobsoni TaxID=62625 RepID=UPI000BF9662E|nr:uncharacterized protein LOC111267737 isoform X6 [Varroa jacobsoni]
MLLDKIESVCVWKIWMRGNDPIMRRFILAVFSVLIVATNYSYGAPTSATVAPGKSSAKSGAADEAIILAPPISPLDESRIEQALNKLKEQLGKPETSGDDAGFDGEDFPEQQIKSFITNKSDAKTSLDEDDKEATDATTKDSLMFEETHNDDQKTEQASLRDDATDRKELNPFQSLPISYLKESVGDEDHEFFIEDPHRMHHFAGPAFRDVFDETDSEDNFSSNDDLILRSDELFSRRPQKESRSEAAKEDDGSSLVEPELIVPEISDEPNIPNRETVVQEKDVLHIDADDNLLKPKEVHKHVEEPSLTLYTAELTPAVIQEHSTETVSAGSSTSSELKPTPEQAFPSTATAASTSTTSETVTAAPFDPLPAKKRIQSGALDGVILEKDSVIISTVQVPNSKDTAISARPTPTIVPASTSATIERLSDSELINETTRASGTTDGQTARPTKPTTSAPSTVQKIPQFIKQIYEAATHRFPSFIHSGSMTEYSSTQSSVAILNKTESLPSNDEAFDVTSTVFSAAADESSPNVTIGPQRSPVGSTGVPQSSDEENYGQGAGTSEHSTQDSAGAGFMPELQQFLSSPTTAAPAAAAPAASENASSTTNISETSTLGPMIVQSTTSAPEDSPIGTLVKGRPCEGQVATRLDRIMDHFPARLPELHEFKRRRFLRAAVIGGLHTLRSTQRNVTCNLTSGTTYWGYRLRGQLDGILNLGITGLPRMYLRFTGPLIVRATFSALGSEDRPVLDSVVVEESRVDEIHYQSVLGFEQPFVERATKYLMHRAMKEEVVTPITEAIQDELLSPKADKSKVLLLDDASHH